MIDVIIGIVVAMIRWVIIGIICWFMIFRYNLFIRLVIYGGLGIAVTAGTAVVALPLLFVSPILILVAVLVVAVIPIRMVFGN